MNRIMFMLFVLFVTATPSMAALRTTVWRPDTADCEIVYQWDDTQIGSAKIDTKVVEIKKCPTYSGTPESIYQQALSENQLKNKVFTEIDHLNPQAVSTSSFSFDAQRNLDIKVEGLTPEQFQTLKKKCEPMSSKLKLHL